MLRHPSQFLLAGLTVAVGLGWGCGGNGCAGLRPLGKEPAPVGFPTEQQIEGGIQVRITKPGFQKLSGAIPELAKDAILKPQCIGKQEFNVVIGKVSVCDTACNNSSGCPVTVALRSDVVKPGGINVSVPDNATKGVINVDAAFDVGIEVPIKFKPIIGGTQTLCTMKFSSPATRLNADLTLDIDGPTGFLTTTGFRIQELKINLKASNCGLVTDILDAVLGFINTIANSFIAKTIINLLSPQLNNLIKGFLPSPPGMVGAVDTGKLLASMGAPKEAALELILAAGGYVSAKGGGLNLGVIAGTNSDLDPKTRGPGKASESSLCVPIRPIPDLAAPPWNLPSVPQRRDFRLDVAPEFAGSPDPVDGMGNIKDLALGVSRTYLDLTGFHLYNSGTMCLQISGSVLSQLSAGTVSVLLPSLSNILENKKGPLALVLRPQQPPVFTLGQGTMADPLIRLGVTDLRIDFYAFIEERYVRLFTLSADLNIGLNLNVTMTKDGKPALQPVVSGIDKKSVMLRASNTDLLAEKPANITTPLLSLIDVAVGQLAGNIAPFALPSFNGFALDGLTITRVQTKQDDFLAIYGQLLKDPKGNMWPLPDDLVGDVRVPDGVKTTVELVEVAVPPVEIIHEALIQGRAAAPGDVPSVTLRLGGNKPLHTLEWQYRFDGAGWSPWSRDARPTLVDPLLLLQGRHKLEVRARVQGDWTTEDQSPEELEILVDSEAPSLRARVEGGYLAAVAEDNVAAEDELRYAFGAVVDGRPSFGPLSGSHRLSYDEAWALSHEGRRPLAVKAVDQAGNNRIVIADLPSLPEFHGRTTDPAPPGGCGCVVGGGRREGHGLLALLVVGLLGGLLGRRRFLRQSGPLALITLLGLGASQLGCGTNATYGGCRVDDDCRGTKCEADELPVCNSGMCGCSADTPMGEIGRFSSLAMRGASAYVAAYNNTYGDLMIGHIDPPGVIKNWQFVDGIPDDGVREIPLSVIRGGITDRGDDVGRYASIATTPTRDPIIAYYDQTNASLRFAAFGALRWNIHFIDKATGVPPAGDDFGRFASLTVDNVGRPGVAYYAEVKAGPSGKRESQLRFAQAKVANPMSPGDWDRYVVESRPMPAPKMGDVALLPEGIAIFCSTARKADGGVVIAYYDRERGNLRYAEFDAAAKKFNAPVILDGENPMGGDTGDVGLYPSLAYEGGVAHVTYVDATRDDLIYLNTKDRQREIVDDGSRTKDEVTLDGLPSPVYHLIGDSSSLQVVSGTLLVAYQDSTVMQLRLAVRDPKTNKWQHQSIAGHATPFRGSYGFYAQNRISGGYAVLSSYAIDQQSKNVPQFFVETFLHSLGGVIQ